MPAAPFSVAVTAACPGWIVITVTGELDMDTSPHLAEAIEALPAQGLIGGDLSAITFMDSCGLSTLLRMRHRLCQEAATLELCGVPHQARRVLEPTGTTPMFTLRPQPGSVDEAQATTAASDRDDPTVLRTMAILAETLGLREIAEYLSWTAAKAIELKELDEFLLARAMEHDSPSLLFRLGCEYLRSAKVIRPGVVTLLEKVGAARQAAEQETHAYHRGPYSG